MQHNIGVIEHSPAGNIQTMSRNDAVARVGALAGLMSLATDPLGGCTIMPTSVSLTE